MIQPAYGQLALPLLEINRKLLMWYQSHGRNQNQRSRLSQILLTSWEFLQMQFIRIRSKEKGSTEKSYTRKTLFLKMVTTQSRKHQIELHQKMQKRNFLCLQVRFTDRIHQWVITIKTISTEDNSNSRQQLTCSDQGDRAIQIHNHDQASSCHR